jgi:hypothetical protein
VLGCHTRDRPRAASLVVLGVLLVLGACERDSRPEARASGAAASPRLGAELDLGALRASAVDGFEAAARDPAVAARLGLARTLERPEVAAALERLLARASEDRELSAAADELFAELQDSPAMREALVEYAREHPELDVSGIRAGFVGYVDRRLTRPEIAELLEAELRGQLRAGDAALARVWVAEAGGATTLAAGVLARLEDPGFGEALGERLGRDPEAVQARLERRLADPARAGELLVGLAPIFESEAGAGALVEILDHPRSAELLAAALTRALAEASVRARCEELFALALAPSFEVAAFERGLEALLAEPAIERELAALLSAIAREPAVREAVAAISIRFVRQPGFDELVLAALA